MENKNSNVVYIAIAIFCYIFSFYQFPLNAQTEHKTASGNSYIYDNNNKTVYSKSAVGSKNENITTEGFSIGNHSIVASTVRNCLSADRLKQLKGQTMVIIFKCDKQGNIKSMKFLFRKECPLSIDEIERIEKAMINQRFIVDSDIVDSTCIQFAVPCFFSRMLNN